MSQPSTPQPLFGGGQPPAASASAGPSTSLVPFSRTPATGSSGNNTYIMPSSPMKKVASDGYRPKVTRTLGQRPACLVNASVTYCGNNQIYAFGGFDQYTDEVYNHVLRLDIVSHQWNLVDNYGDIPGVRMGMYSYQCWTLPRYHQLADLKARPYRDLVSRRQTSCVRRRERA